MTRQKTPIPPNIVPVAPPHAVRPAPGFPATPGRSGPIDAPWTTGPTTAAVVAPTIPAPVRSAGPVPLGEPVARIPNLTGETIEGYTMISRLSATTDLYLARSSMGQEVLVKMLDPAQTAVLGSGWENRIAEEARVIANRETPSPVRISQVKVLEGGASKCAMVVLNPAKGQAANDADVIRFAVESIDHLLTTEQFIGQVIKGYCVDKLVGIGGMGSVFSATHTDVAGRRVAIKIPSRDRSAAILARFDTEIATLGSLDHPHICTFNNVERLADGRIALLMAYVEGSSINEMITRKAFPHSSQGARSALVIARQILSALEYAHGRGIIHRDIKPSNVMVTQVSGEPHAHLMDFGIAKTESATTRTATGAVAGTPAYLAPEVLHSGGREVSARSDLYAFGVMVFEMLSGMHPFATAADYYNPSKPGRTLSEVGMDVSPSLTAFLARLIVKDPAQRFQSAQEARLALEQLPEYRGIVDKTDTAGAQDPAAPGSSHPTAPAVAAPAASPSLVTGRPTATRMPQPPAQVFIDSPTLEPRSPPARYPRYRSWGWLKLTVAAGALAAGGIWASRHPAEVRRFKDSVAQTTHEAMHGIRTLIPSGFPGALPPESPLPLPSDSPSVSTPQPPSVPGKRPSRMHSESRTGKHRKAEAPDAGSVSPAAPSRRGKIIVPAPAEAEPAPAREPAPEEAPEEEMPK